MAAEAKTIDSALVAEAAFAECVCHCTRVYLDNVVLPAADAVNHFRKCLQLCKKARRVCREILDEDEEQEASK